MCPFSMFHHFMALQTHNQLTESISRCRPQMILGSLSSATQRILRRDVFHDVMVGSEDVLCCAAKERLPCIVFYTTRRVAGCVALRCLNSLLFTYHNNVSMCVVNVTPCTVEYGRFDNYLKRQFHVTRVLCESEAFQ